MYSIEVEFQITNTDESRVLLGADGSIFFLGFQEKFMQFSTGYQQKQESSCAETTPNPFFPLF